MNCSLQFGSEKIDYTLSFIDRKTLGIAVDPDRNVLVKAPLGCSLGKIEEKVRKKAPWILKQKAHFLSFEPRTPKRSYVSGETHLYLGRQYQLKVIISKTEEVKYTGRYIEVYCKNKNRAKLLLQNWYMLRAQLWFKKIANPLIKRFENYDVSPDEIEIRSMKLRWGSCSSNGKILLNPELIKAPKACIQYVILHELCHLVFRDHTKAFFDLQTKEMPDWKKWKYKLEQLLS